MATENKTPNKAPPKPAADAEALRLKKEEKSRAARRRNRQFIGLALTVLIVVGAVSIVLSGVNLAQSLMDDTDEKAAYEELFAPLIWFEMIPFESVTQVDENSVKQVCIWGALSEQGDGAARNQRGEPMVSAASVDQYGVQLFGPDFRFSGHESFADAIYDLRYSFDAETNMYTAPSTGLMPPYLATVVDIVGERGGVKRVVVGYVSTLTGDDQIIATPDLAHPAFYMDYMLQRDGRDYYLFAIRRNTTHSPDASAPASSPPSSASEAESAPAPIAQPSSPAGSSSDSSSGDTSDATV